MDSAEGMDRSDWDKRRDEIAEVTCVALLRGFQRGDFARWGISRVVGLHAPLVISTMRCKTSTDLAKGFCKRSFGRSFRFGGGRFRAKFLLRFSVKFFTKFSGLFCWDIQSKNKLQRKLQPRIHMTLHSKTGEISGKNFMTRFCRGTLAKYRPAYIQKELTAGLQRRKIHPKQSTQTKKLFI